MLVQLRLSSSAVRERLVVACASRRPTANGRAEVARLAVESGTAVGNIHGNKSIRSRKSRIDDPDLDVDLDESTRLYTFVN